TKSSPQGTARSSPPRLPRPSCTCSPVGTTTAPSRGGSSVPFSRTMGSYRADPRNGREPPSPLLHLQLLLLFLARGRGPGRDVLGVHCAFRQAGVAEAALLDVREVLRAGEDGAAAEPLLLGARGPLLRQAGEEGVEDRARQGVALARIDVAE